MRQRQLGKHGPLVSTVGLGCMGMSGLHGPADRAESLATIHAALGAGITLLDTGDFYGMGISVAQAAIAWVAAQGEDVVPVIGARRRDQLAEAGRAVAVILGPDDMAAIEAAAPMGAAAGARYPAPAMIDLDSER